MLTLDQIESGVQCTHKNTKLRYSVVEVGDEEVLLSPQSEGMQDLVVPVGLFCQEFVIGDRYSDRGTKTRRGRRPGGVAALPTGPKARGRIKKMVRDRGFGFIRGDDGKEVFFHRSGLNGADYDSLSEGDAVEYVIQEGPRGARAEHVRSVGAEATA
jgi:CspA family cold shock protein